MQVEQLKLELRRGQDSPLDPTQRPDKVWIRARLESAHCTGNRQSGIEMSASAATGEENAHPYARSNTNDGSVARPPITFSRVLPMFTSMPVISIERTRLDLP